MKCGSLRMVKFVDGFGKRRIFCRGCWGSFIDLNQLNGQTKLKDFDFNIYYNPQAIVRHFR